ncbi:hypothetical protein J7384_17055 [Endozoicomonas sp. G2_1]|uniref:hypothetical protein n=1 Tax=Endozoicomonas sp. G2_1 TaxID=2821091 RepID=UPI001ADA0D37|nr:hypothetical protein [Endozoicomonas sp. G2_1]MBO9492073.1 hypothetical protein [Endozoicomonas sp. G2_1]
MAISASEIKYFKTTNNLGGAITSSEISSGSLENIFPNFTSAEAAAGIVKYACIYVRNTNTSDTLTSVKHWIATQTPSPTTSVEVGLGTAAANASEQVISNITTAPTGVTFSTAANEANSLPLPDLAPDAYKSIWIKWTVNTGTAAIAVDNAVLTTKGDTPPA